MISPELDALLCARLKKIERRDRVAGVLNFLSAAAFGGHKISLEEAEKLFNKAMED